MLSFCTAASEAFIFMEVQFRDVHKHLYCIILLKKKPTWACLETAVCSNQSLGNKSCYWNSLSNKIAHANRISESFVKHVV